MPDGGEPTLEKPSWQSQAKGRRLGSVLSGATLAIGIAVSAIGLSISFLGVGVASAAGNAPNSCGCYQDSSGGCLCGKKARCGCPGACEPRGCEEKRAKEINKQIEVETRKAEQAGRRYAHASGGAERAASPAKATERGSTREATSKVVHMTATQRKELGRLLDLYTSEHRDQGNKTLNQVRGELAGPSP